MKLNFDKKLIKRGETVAVAFSGGKDSTALIFALIDYQNEFDFTLKAINIEHGIRGKESIRDSEFCKDFCQKFNIELKTYQVDARNYSFQNKLSLEEGARKLRYDCFYNAINCGFCDKIATAHHKSDQAETVLFNLFRGTSLSGTSGITEISNDNRLIRPLLRVSQQEIIDFINFYKLPFVTDSSNDETKFSRNYLRQEIIPLIEKRFLGATDNVCNFSHVAKADDEYLYSLSEKEIIIDGEIQKVLANLPQPIFSRAIKLIFKNFGINKDYTKKHFDACYLLTQNTSGAKVILPNGVYAVREYDYIVFSKTTPKATIDLPFSLVDYICDEFIIKFEIICKKDYDNREKQAYKSINSSFLPSETLYCDYSFFKNAKIKNITDGAVFEKFSGGSKSINKFLIDKKIPSRIRRDLVVITADDGYALAISGVEISKRVKITDTTKEILKITTIKR